MTPAKDHLKRFVPSFEEATFQSSRRCLGELAENKRLPSISTSARPASARACITDPLPAHRRAEGVAAAPRAVAGIAAVGLGARLTANRLLLR